uniref:protein-tyrosine-phosphatase n=1 Tax=Latimeria chalumnae TaxID=7897 RepID=H3B8P7_LATCH
KYLVFIIELLQRRRKIQNFESYFRKQQADSNCGFAAEFEDLKPIGTSQSKQAAEIPENKSKNRYSNVVPYDSSRVKLLSQGVLHDDYINANYMPGYNSKKEFIAAQGPLANTVIDFWRMVWEKNVHTIVMLTKCVELGRAKCEEYWPSSQTRNYGHVAVTMGTETVLPEWTVRDFVLKNVKTNEKRKIQHFHFTSWPDHGVPETTELLINFRHLVREHMKQNLKNAPALVHCSAGVGRTGTFITIDHLIYQIEYDEVVDIFKIVFNLRMCRPLMVQTEEQYIFLNKCALDFIRSKNSRNVDLIYQNTTAMDIYENINPVVKSNGH